MHFGGKYEPTGLGHFPAGKRRGGLLRLLVVSDSHGDVRALVRAVRSQPDAAWVIHLGDGEQDVEEAQRFLKEKRVMQVSGNCDFCSSLPAVGSILLNGVRIFFTHGHLYGVKGGDSRLKAAARAQGADVVLYGHTHVATAYYEDGLYVLNPGSVRDRGSCGVVDITEAGIVTNLIRER